MSYKNYKELCNGQSSFNSNVNFRSNSINSAHETPSIIDLMRKFSLTDDSLSQKKAKAFLSEIYNKIKDKNFISNYDWNIEVLYLKSLHDSCVVIAENKAIVLITAVTNPLKEHVPTIILEKKAQEELIKHRPNVQILMSIIIAPEDCECADRFVDYLRRVFIAELAKQQVSLGDDLNDNILGISEVPTYYESAYRQFSPHAVPLRHDLNMTIYLQPKSKNKICNNLKVSEADLYRNPDSDARKFVAIIGGYVEFIQDRPLAYKYMPVVHISEILSANLDKALIPFLLKLAIKKFIDNGRWLEYLRNCDFADQINFGSLFPDDKGNPSVLSKYENFEKAVNNSLDHVQLVLDVTDGRAAIPGLNKFFSYDVDTDNVHAGITEINPARIYSQFYRGYCHHYNEVFDSANIDFLNEYGRCPYKTHKDYQSLLVQKTPENRAKDEMKFESQVNYYYRTDVVGITPELLTDLISKMMSQHVIHVSDIEGILST